MAGSITQFPNYSFLNPNSHESRKENFINAHVRASVKLDVLSCVEFISHTLEVCESSYFFIGHLGWFIRRVPISYITS